MIVMKFSHFYLKILYRSCKICIRWALGCVSSRAVAEGEPGVENHAT